MECGGLFGTDEISLAASQAGGRIRDRIYVFEERRKANPRAGSKEGWSTRRESHIPTSDNPGAIGKPFAVTADLYTLVCSHDAYRPSEYFPDERNSGAICFLIG